MDVWSTIIFILLFGVVVYIAYKKRREIDTYIKKRMKDQNEIKDIEKQAYVAEMKKMAVGEGQRKAREKIKIQRERKTQVENKRFI